MNRKNNKKPTLLVILDGLGLAPPGPGNAFHLAKTPFIDSLFKEYPNTQLKASGTSVGLPHGQHGNSEAGHMNIGSGRVVLQDSVKITNSIENKSFFENAAFLESIKHVKKHNSSLHIMGLISRTQSPHMDPNHLEALIKLCHQKKVKKVYCHFFTDGRDSPQFAALEIIKKIKKKLKPNQKIATLAGRYYLNRKKDWPVTEKIYNTLVLGEDDLFDNSVKAIVHNYNQRHTDEFIQPTIIAKNNKEKMDSRIDDNDSVIFYNLRSDRARQLTKPFVQDKFRKMNPGAFKRKKILKNIRFVAMTNFGPDLPGVLTAYPAESLNMTLPLTLTHLQQLYLTETEKYAHLTYFFNGGHNAPIGGEEREVINSPSVRNYKETPKMSSPKILNRILEVLEKDKYHFISVNFCNPDMIGHTGKLKAGIKAMEYLDGCLKKLVIAVLNKNGTLFITADHGNIEKMTDLETGEVNTEHTSNPVPFIMVNKNSNKYKFDKSGVLGNIAPTILKFLDINKPQEMTKKSLCQF
ncbi:MAG: 2,3-bisphosphoglycerate-independent phosphoglycerate mutase [Patescibacteria group bacterium]|nr:2,3-bisphosphoglycerate-independent phosphoglycerate mutase [Patescibacteria group bacterium]